MDIRQEQDVISILLKDRSRHSHNIVWATPSYEGFNPEDEICTEIIEKSGDTLIIPRIEKSRELQKARTKSKAEVFTPTWVVEKMNDSVEAEFKDLPLDEYIDKMWLEITCGEAPYMVSRYDTVTGERLEIQDRVGFIDRKLQRISKELHDHDEWLAMAKRAYKASYGYEYQGDSLFIARENLLYTFIEFYKDKFLTNPNEKDILEVAEIISYNVFQMDGLKYTLPYNDGIDARVMDWETHQPVRFKDLNKKEGK